MRFACILLSILLVAVSSALAQKMDPEQIFQKNLESVASAEKRAALKNLTALAEVKYSVGPNHKEVFNGPAVIVTEGSKMALAFSLPFQDYPQEKFSYDDKALRIGFALPGFRSLLGEFLHTYEEIVKVHSLASPFRRLFLAEDATSRTEKFSFEGVRKLDGREVFVISLAPRAGSGLSTRFYYDKETFRHLRTEFTRTVGATIGTRGEVPEHTSDTRQEMIEEFSDFKTENGVTLPRKYKLSVTVETGQVTRDVLYVFSLKKIFLNQPLDPATFNISELK